MNDELSNSIDKAYNEQELTDDEILNLSDWIDDRVVALRELDSPEATNMINNLTNLKNYIYEPSSYRARTEQQGKKIKKSKVKPIEQEVAPNAAQSEEIAKSTKEVKNATSATVYKVSELEGARVNIDGEVGVVEKTDSGYVLNTGEELLPIEDEEIEAQLIERGAESPGQPKQSQKKIFETSVDQAISDLDITQEQADALKQTTSANAQNWAKRTGKTEEEFYEKFKPTVSRDT